MINKDVVTAAAALAHSVPGAELLLRRTDGGRLLVAGHSRADLSPCTFRHLVADGPCPIAKEVETWLGSIEPRGTLEHAVAGVYRSRHRAGERWFVADLHPTRLRQVFDGLLGLVVEVIVLQAVAGRSQGGEMGAGARATHPSDRRTWPRSTRRRMEGGIACTWRMGKVCAVSYTHLTLPTILLV